MNNISTFYETLKWALSSTWPMLTLFIIILTVTKISSSIINHEKIIFYKEFYHLLSIIYILLLYYLLLTTESATKGINLIPFKEMTRYSIGSKSFMYNVLGNILLFIPFGYFISDTIKAQKIHQVLITTVTISLTAELIQYRIGRAFDVDDIILNALGAIIGFIIYISIKKVTSKLPKVLQKNWFYNLIALLVAVVIGLIIAKTFGIGWF